MSCRQRGLALVAVLWLVAALSLMATAMTQSVRSEARTTARTRDLVVASALGESAMQLALQSLVVSGKRPDRLVRDEVPYAGTLVAVQAAPLNGYIDINRAPVELLAQMLQTAAGLPPDRAGPLAHAIVEHRTTAGPSGRPDTFEAPEDLLRVPGLEYPVYAGIAPLVTAGLGGSGGVNPLAAPPQVLRVLAAGNDAAVAHFLAGREADQVGLDQSAFNAAWLDSGGSEGVELVARVPLADGGAVRVVRRYFLGARGTDGLPWRVFHAENFFEPPAVSGP
ncbi:general secretion pathway protein K [Melaminivora alkalimesophila]|uniref:General secretion pathway protein K n=1 Tax=Melaminivora alkalimesophila TaxID=1165852 RepID=A0A317RAG1_9BURK|nr:general secretion pathway protein GspK [Melaminivora alkalimesophila]PWW43747.1 general secretion pathway protein K [Melaminivora alkalimesophila]